MGSSEPTVWILVLAAECGGGTWQFSYPRQGFTLLLTVRWTPYWTESPVASSPEACTLWQGLFLTRRYLVRAQGRPIFPIPAPTGERSSQKGKTGLSFSVHPKAILFLLTGPAPAPLTWSGILLLPIPSLPNFSAQCLSICHGLYQLLVAVGHSTYHCVIKHMVSYWLGRSLQGGKTFRVSSSLILNLVPRAVSGCSPEGSSQTVGDWMNTSTRSGSRLLHPPL